MLAELTTANKELLATIAKAIGHHFWHCETDEQALRWGMDAAKDVQKAISDHLDGLYS